MLFNFKKITNPPKSLLRDVPGWTNAPVPICMNGDYRALAWCCKPGHALTSGMVCKRDLRLKQIGLTREELIEIKQQFSDEQNWDSEYSCFGSFSYCCMRFKNCPARDAGFHIRYPGKTYEEIFAEYARLKIELADRLLKAARNQELVAHLISTNINFDDNLGRRYHVL